MWPVLRLKGTVSCILKPTKQHFPVSYFDECLLLNQILWTNVWIFTSVQLWTHYCSICFTFSNLSKVQNFPPSNFRCTVPLNLVLAQVAPMRIFLSAKKQQISLLIWIGSAKIFILFGCFNYSNHFYAVWHKYSEIRWCYRTYTVHVTWKNCFPDF
jgi:hypothetical protein